MTSARRNPAPGLTNLLESRMTMTEAGEDRINLKLENLGDQVSELKDLILREITDLKNEQIADLRRDNERLADDQRRSWEAIRSLEADRNHALGGGKVVYMAITAVLTFIGSSAAAVFLTKFFK